MPDAPTGFALSGRTALVTGGAVRVGKALALALARRGARVAITYRSSAAEAETTAAELQALSGASLAVRCDQRDPQQITAALAAIESALGPVDVLANNASAFRRTPLVEATLDDWDEHLEANLRGPWLFCQALGPAMKARGGGVILNLLDVMTQHPAPAYLPYAASKAGLTALTLGLAKALAPEVRVNGIAPGVALWPEEYPEAQKQSLLRQTPLGRAGTPEEIAAAALYLIETAGFVTGAVLPLDGGLSLR